MGAPEIINLPKKSRGYGLPVDVWAAGVVMYMLLVGGQHPFHSDKGLDVGRLLKGELVFSDSEGSGLFAFIGPTPKERFSEKAEQLCRQLINPCAASRVTALAALQNSWFLTERAIPVDEPRQPRQCKPPQKQDCKVNGQKTHHPTGPKVDSVENTDTWWSMPRSDWMLPILENDGQWWPFQSPWQPSERQGSSNQEAQRKIEMLERRLSEAQSQLQAQAQAQAAQAHPQPPTILGGGRGKKASASPPLQLSPDKARMAAELCAMGFSPIAIVEAVDCCNSLEDAAAHIVRSGGARILPASADSSGSTIDSAAETLRADLLAMGFDPTLCAEAAKRFSLRSDAVDWIVSLS